MQGAQIFNFNSTQIKKKENNQSILINLELKSSSMYAYRYVINFKMEI